MNKFKKGKPIPKPSNKQLFSPLSHPSVTPSSIISSKSAITLPPNPDTLRHSSNKKTFFKSNASEEALFSKLEAVEFFSAYLQADL